MGISSNDREYRSTYIRSRKSISKGTVYNEDYIHKTCKEFDIKNYTINKDLTIDAFDNIDGYELL